MERRIKVVGVVAGLCGLLAACGDVDSAFDDAPDYGRLSVNGGSFVPVTVASTVSGTVITWHDHNLNGYTTGPDSSMKVTLAAGQVSAIEFTYIPDVAQIAFERYSCAGSACQGTSTDPVNRSVGFQGTVVTKVPATTPSTTLTLTGTLYY